MAARTVKCEKLRRTTVSVVPYVPCSAKLAVIACVTSRIFDGNAFVALSLYAVCLAAVAVAASILNKTTDGNEASVEITELPDYRLPKLSVAGRQMLSAATGFLKKAGTTIVVTSVLLWGCRYFTPAFGKAVSEEDSICGVLGKIISPLFAPLGFDDGNCGYAYAVATIVGLSAKEAAVATLTVLGGGTLPAISPLGAYCWALYNLLTVPCIATVAASAAEQGRKNAAVAFILQAGLAYVFTLIARTIGLAVSSLAR
jgi:ferrous iron transport protein B